MKILVSALLSMEDIIMVKQFCSRCKNGIQILRNHTHILIIYTLLCRFTNCKFAVQSNVGLPRLAQLRYSTVHRWGVFNFLFLVFKQTKLQLKTVKQVYTVLHIQFLLLHVCIVIRACARIVKIGFVELYTVLYSDVCKECVKAQAGCIKRLVTLDALQCTENVFS